MDFTEIKNKANSLFAPLFPNIQCEEPYIESETLFIPFTWGILSNGLMAFSQTGIDPFKCRPFQFENASVDWIKMKYLTKEPIITKMEVFLRPFFEI